jgi:hypothetical protein
MKFLNFTKSTINFINSLNWKISSSHLPNFKINQDYKPLIIDLYQNEKFFNSKFLPEEIKKDMETYPNILKLRVDNLDYFIYGKKNSEEIVKIKKILKSLSMINNFLRIETKNIDKTISVIIYLTPFKKEFSGDILQPININSGVTEEMKRILIFREEEWTKVLIHELIHAYGFDKYQFIKNPLVMGDDILDEAITEFYAILLHSKWISIVSEIDYKSILRYEIAFSILQSLKLLSFLKIKNNEDFISFKDKKIRMDTSAFSYFIIKTEFLLNYKKYKNYLDKKELPKDLLEENNLKDFKILKYFKYIELKQDNNARMSLFQID